MKKVTITKPTLNTSQALNFATGGTKEKKANTDSQQPSKTHYKPIKGTSGLVPEGDMRLTANIREDLHLKLKLAAAHRRTTIGDLIEELVEKHL